MSATTTFALLPVGNAVDTMTQSREREKGLEGISLAPKLLNWLTSILCFSYRFLATTNFLQAECWGREGWQMFTWVWVVYWAIFLFCSYHYLNPWKISENCQGEQIVHLWVLDHEKWLGEKGEWESKQVIGVDGKGIYTLAFLVQINRQVFSVFPTLCIFCSCALTFLTTHILSLLFIFLLHNL